MYEKSERSVWQIAGIGICVFLVIMFVSGGFGGSEVVVAASN